MKLAWGFDKFISLEAFNDAANGYLVDDTTVFGAEVYVCQEKIAGKGECLSMIKDAIAYKNTWRFDFSNLTEECKDSTPFNAADHKWYAFSFRSIIKFPSEYIGNHERINLFSVQQFQEGSALSLWKRQRHWWLFISLSGSSSTRKLASGIKTICRIYITHTRPS